MLGEIPEQAIHLGEIGAIDQVAALLLNADQTCVRQLLQMKGQRVARHAELFCQDAGHHSGKACHDKRAKGPQSLGMGKGAER